MRDSGIKSVYFGLSGDDYTRARAETQMQADAFEAVLDRQREADRQEYERREAERRDWEYRHSAEYLEAQRRYHEKCKQWQLIYGDIWENIAKATAPNLPENADEAREVIDYVNTNKEYPAPYDKDKELKSMYQKLIQYRMDGQNQYAENCAKRISTYWRNLVSVAFTAVTKCPDRATKDNIHKYLKPYLSAKKTTLSERMSRWSNKYAASYYTDQNLPVPDYVQATYDADKQKAKDADEAVRTEILDLYNYLITYNDELKLD